MVFVKTLTSDRMLKFHCREAPFLLNDSIPLNNVY
jgi:hypothetical protein